MAIGHSSLLLSELLNPSAFVIPSSVSYGWNAKESEARIF